MISPTPASEATVFNVGQTPLLYPSTGPYYPGNGIVPALAGGVAPDSGGYPGFADIYLRTLAAGPRTDVAKEKFDRVLVGLEGSGFGWDYNVGALHTRDRVTDSYTDGYLSESRLLRSGGLTPKDPGYIAAVLAAGGINPAINPFSVSQTPAGQAALDAAEIRQVVRTGDSKRDSVDGHASRDLFNLPAGPLQLAVGGEGRLERYADNPAPIFSSGDIIGSGGDLQPINAQRHVYAGFFELNAPIVKNLEAGLAARYDHYEDFGSTTNPKATLRWQPTPELLLRGSVGTGFRAPTLPELYTGTTQTNSGGVYNDPYYDSSNGGNRCTTQFNGTYCNAQLKVKQGGNTALQPEKSHQYTVGFLLEPARDLSFGADYFYIKQRQLIGVVNADVQLQDFVDNFNPTTRTSSSQYAGNVATRFDPTTGTTVIDYVGNFNQNLGIQITKGFDFSFRSRFPLSAYGAITLALDSTYIISQKNKTPGQEQYTEDVGQFAVFGPVQRYQPGHHRRVRLRSLRRRGGLQLGLGLSRLLGHAQRRCERVVGRARQLHGVQVAQGHARHQEPARPQPADLRPGSVLPGRLRSDDRRSAWPDVLRASDVYVQVSGQRASACEEAAVRRGFFSPARRSRPDGPTGRHALASRRSPDAAAPETGVAQRSYQRMSGFAPTSGMRAKRWCNIARFRGPCPASRALVASVRRRCAGRFPT